MADFANRLNQLRERFLERLACDLRQIEEIAAGEPSVEQLECLQHVAHRLAGISGSIGYPDVSRAALALDREWNPSGAVVAELRAKVEVLRDAAGKHLPMP